MKRLLTLLCCVLICSTGAYSQAKKTKAKASVAAKPADKELKKMVRGKVREIVETNTAEGVYCTNIFRFNERGQIATMIFSKIGSNTTTIIDNEYNQEGKISRRSELTSEKERNGDGFEVRELDPISIQELPFGKEEYYMQSSEGSRVSTYLYVNGKLSEKTTESKSKDYGEGSEISTYLYANGKLAKEISIHEDKDRQYEMETEYYANGEIRKRIWKDEESINEYTYNMKGEQTSHKKDGKRVATDMEEDDDPEGCGDEIKKYDILGRLIKYSYCSDIVYKYNTLNFLIYTLISTPRYYDEVITYQGYIYDENKNWTQRTMHITGDDTPYGSVGLTITATRKISYYD